VLKSISMVIAVRTGIHRGWESDQDKTPRRAWVSCDSGDEGEWVTEAEYRAAGYSPEFESLPVKVVQSMPVPDDLWDKMCEADKRFIDEWIEKNAQKPNG
jgi:hypothetical protein